MQSHGLEGVGLQSCDLVVQAHGLEGMGLQSCDLEVQLVHNLGWVGHHSLAVHQSAAHVHSGPGRVHWPQHWVGRRLAHDYAVLHSHWVAGYAHCLRGRGTGQGGRGHEEGVGPQHLMGSGGRMWNSTARRVIPACT